MTTAHDGPQTNIEKADGDSLNFDERIAELEKRFSDRLAQLERRLDSRRGRSNSIRSGTNGEHGDTREPSAERQETNEAPLQDAPTSRVSLKIVMSRKDEDGKWFDEDPKEPAVGERVDDANAPPYASLLRKYEDGESEIEIHDPDLRQLLATLLQHWPHQFTGVRVRFTSPFESLVFKWDVLWAEATKEVTGDDKLRLQADLMTLLKQVRTSSGDLKLDKYFSTRDDHKKQRVISFDALWTIFPPGTKVVGRLFGQQHQRNDRNQIFVVQDNKRTWPAEGSRRSGGPRPWALSCWYYDYTGEENFRRHSVTLYFTPFQDPVPITSLDYVPLDALEAERAGSKAEIEAKLLERGKRFRKLCTKDDERMYRFTGRPFIDQEGFRDQGDGGDYSSDSDSDYTRRRRRRRPSYKTISRAAAPLEESNVMVDFKSYAQYGPGISRIEYTHVDTNIEDECECPDCEADPVQREIFRPYYDDMAADAEWEDLQYILCPPRVMGYVLKDKQWVQLAVDELSEIPKSASVNTRAMDDLHLAGADEGKQVKELLFSLISSHGSAETELKDIVPDKGKGLVVLLYGAPGVGKTSTAQKLANAARKPLFSIGVADVGTRAKKVETNLENIFDLATIWKAILLIDEADVFLQNRMGGVGPSAEGSALVSVFLRVLEYYRGILFLTTNQIAQFDVAVQSRVHIAVKYESLNDVQTNKIFLGFVNQYRRDGKVGEEDFREIEEYAREDLYQKHFDGRQLRNIVSSAIGFASGKAGGGNRLKLKDIKTVVKYVEDFQKDLAGQLREWQQQQKNARLG